MTAMLLGCVTEIIGYIGRILYYDNPWNDTGFIMQIGHLFCTCSEVDLTYCPVLIIIGPVFFLATIFVLLALM